MFGKRYVFSRMLRNFWPEEKINTWEAAVFLDDSAEHGLETARNMITLSVEAHGLWNSGAFALKPISVSEDNTTLIIQLFGQARYSPIMPTINLTTIPLSTRDLDHGNRERPIDFRQSEVRMIKSGDLFELTTDDPEARLLLRRWKYVTRRSTALKHQPIVHDCHRSRLEEDRCMIQVQGVDIRWYVGFCPSFRDEIFVIPVASAQCFQCEYITLMAWGERPFAYEWFSTIWGYDPRVSASLEYGSTKARYTLLVACIRVCSTGNKQLACGLTSRLGHIVYHGVWLASEPSCGLAFLFLDVKAEAIPWSLLTLTLPQNGLWHDPPKVDSVDINRWSLVNVKC